MELVEFMSNKECVVETFKVNGLIAKDNTVTEKGLMAIQFYLDMIEQKKPELENCQTAYMSCSEVEEWEKKNAAASVSFDSGGVVEFLPIEMFSKDAKIEKKQKERKAMERKTAWNEYKKKDMKKLEKLNAGYRAFLDHGKTERECVKDLES